MSYMFSRCTSLISLPDISKWNTENIEKIADMFDECDLLLALPDLSNSDVTENEY